MLGTRSPAHGPLPAELGVALVAGDHGAELPRAGHGGSQLGHIQDATVGVAGRVQPDQACAVGPFGGVIRGERRRPDELRTHLVGGIGRARVHDDVARADVQQQRQQGDELFGADRGQHLADSQSGHAAPAVVPGRDGFAQGRGADRLRVRVRVGARAQRVGDDGGGRIHRRPDRQVDGTPGVCGGAARVWGDGVPGVVVEVADGHEGQCSWGGSAAMMGWSFGITPTLAAPPGEPMSSKNSTFAV